MKTKITLTPLYLLLVFALLFNGIIYAQCDDASVDDLKNVGPYRVATLKESDGLRNGPDYTEATLYYPTNATGTSTSIVVIPGYTTPASYMQRWGSFYASHGIVAFIVNVNSVNDFPDKRANALLDAIETIKRENTRSNSPLRGKIDTDRFAVSGHSMGGGGSLLAANMSTDIKAVIPLNPWLPNTRSTTFSNIQAATLIISGESDGTAGVDAHANRHYTNTSNSINKAIFEVRRGNHQSAFSPTSSNGIVGKLALAWLKVFLEDSSCYCDVLSDDVLTSSISSDVRTNFGCSTLSNNEFEDKSAVTIYPNPTSSNITIKNINFSKAIDYNITNLSGQQLLSGNITSNKQNIDISNLASSIYFLNIGETTFKVVKD